jgi:hypothetical protein
MYIRKEISKKTWKFFFKDVLKISDENGTGSICQRYGSADPDPHPDSCLNFMDPQHWY